MVASKLLQVKLMNLIPKLTILITTVILASCATDHGQVLVKSEERLARFKHKETSKKDAYYLMGQPNMVLDGKNGETCWKYAITTIGMAPSSMIPILGAFVGGYTNKTQILSINFNNSGLYERMHNGYKESTNLYYEGFNANDNLIKTKGNMWMERMREEMKSQNLPFDEPKANGSLGVFISSVLGFAYKDYDKIDCDLSYLEAKK